MKKLEDYIVEDWSITLLLYDTETEQEEAEIETHDLDKCWLWLKENEKTICFTERWNFQTDSLVQNEWLCETWEDYITSFSHTQILADLEEWYADMCEKRNIKPKKVA